MVARDDRQLQGAQAPQTGIRNWLQITLVVVFTSITGLAIAQTAQEVRELLEWGDNDIARERAEKGLEKNPDDAELKFYHALALARTGETEDALEAFKELAEQFPDHPEVHNNIAVLYALEGKYEEARAALEAALGTDKAYETAHKNLGDIYSAQAAEAYNRALARDEQRDTPKPELNLLSTWESKSPVAPQTTVSQAEAAPGKTENKPLKVISTAETAKPAKAKADPVKAAPAPETATENATEPKAPVTEKPAPEPKVAAKAEAKPEPVKAAPKPSKDEPYKVTAEPAEKAAAKVAVKADKTPAPEAKPKASAAPAKEAPAPVIAPAQAEQAAKAIESWAAAWRSQNADAYISAYASFFRPENGLSHTAWAKQRRSRITSPKYIRVKLRNMRIRLKGEGRAIASFQQDYQSDSYQDSVKKTLYLENIKGDWLIVREVSE